MKTEPSYLLPYLEETDLVEDLAEQSKKLAEGLAAAISSPTFQGIPGEPGPPGDPGIPGVDAVPADEAVAAYIASESSQTRAALQSSGIGVTSVATETEDGLMSAADKVKVDAALRTDTGKLIAGPDAAAALPPAYDIGTSGTVVALGAGAMKNMTKVKKSIAIGPNALGEGDTSRDNIAIGEDALRFTEALSPDYTQTGTDGTRNVAIGGNAARFNASGVGHVAIGRNAGQNIVSGNGLVAIGNGAHSSLCPIGLSGQIENWAPAGGTADTTWNVTAVGQWALSRNLSSNNTAVGGSALRFATTSTNCVAVGANALRRVDETAWLNGKTTTAKNITGTYAQVGTVLTLTFVGHGAKVGDIVSIRLLDGASQTFGTDPAPAYVTGVSGDTVTVSHPISRTASGTALLLELVDNTTTPATANYSTAVGSAALAFVNSGTSNTALGYESGSNLVSGSSNTFVGSQAGKGATGASGSNNTGIGYQSLTALTTGQHNAALGFRAGYATTTGTFNTFFGYGAGRYLVSGSENTASTNSTALGNDSRVSGDNQVQIGNSATTTYVYGTVQNRSDLRDKADVRDTVLGLDFINALRPVDYRWDMREDYDGERDGTKKRDRYHHGLIAQEVADLIAETGVDFGGYQDHTVSGGDDVLTLGYDELIAPLIKAVQQLTARVAELESH